MREIILDTETTGLDPASGHRIVEIGCVEMVHKMRTGKTFHAYINPERDMPPEAERVHGLSAKFLSDKPVFAQIVGDLLDFLADSALVIHNAAFDMKFMNHELERHGFPAMPITRAVDTVAVARKKFPGSPASLDALCKRFNIDLSARTKHGALLDAELLSDVYIELNGGRQVAISFAQAAATVVEEVTVTERIVIPERIFAVSEAELQTHQAFIQKLKNPLWPAE